MTMCKEVPRFDQEAEVMRPQPLMKGEQGISQTYIAGKLMVILRYLNSMHIFAPTLGTSILRYNGRSCWNI